MKTNLIIILLSITSLTCWAANKVENVILICVDDLRPELACYGKDYIQSPNIDKLASQGRMFTRHYVQAPTCGASRYALFTGTYGPSDNMALFERARRNQADLTAIKPTLPAWFRKHGFKTIAIGKVSHHPGSMGGENWNDPNILEMPYSWDENQMPYYGWEDPRGAMHGLANGEIRLNSKYMDVYQSKPGIYPDDLITSAALEELDQLSGENSTPFFLAIGLLKPHLPFGAPARFMKPYKDCELPPIPHPEKPDEPNFWHPSNEFFQYNVWDRDPRNDNEFADEIRRHYAACVTYTDYNIGRILTKIEETGLAQNTVIVLWGDHGWHLGEHGIWGKHSLYEESLRSPLIVKTPVQNHSGITTDAIVETVDLYPTLCDMMGLPKPTFLDGESFETQIDQPAQSDDFAISYFKSPFASGRSLRTSSHRLIAHENGEMELYRHDTPETISENLADEEPETVNAMLFILNNEL